MMSNDQIRVEGGEGSSSRWRSTTVLVALSDDHHHHHQLPPPPPQLSGTSLETCDWNTSETVLEKPRPPVPLSQCNYNHVQAWGDLDALIGRLRAAYEENGGLPENNPFASGAIRVYLREVRDFQAKSRGISYKKKKKKRKLQIKSSTTHVDDQATSATFDHLQSS
ncbi:hypothetical protein HAX54_044409 [Datura stramonium]|uniref:ALOG domain-containing protein n=1 Tax=Datura stramonium TaxID=4076 RepID=A0ABS8WIB4_DATST|nr:hypothetical protein [Datura stramonium]